MSDKIRDIVKHAQLQDAMELTLAAYPDFSTSAGRCVFSDEVIIGEILTRLGSGITCGYIGAYSKDLASAVALMLFAMRIPILQFRKESELMRNSGPLDLNERIHSAYLPISMEDSLACTAEVLQFGTRKHPGNEWKRISVESHVGSILRHLSRFRELDDETGWPHLAHAVARTWMVMQKTGL